MRLSRRKKQAVLTQQNSEYVVGPSREILGGEIVNTEQLDQNIINGLRHFHDLIHKVGYLIHDRRPDKAAELLEQCQEPLELLIKALRQAPVVRKKHIISSTGMKRK